MARSAGFDNLSLDLMFALPGQDSKALQIELDALLQLQPEHVSLYGLSYEAGTEFAARLAHGPPVDETDTRVPPVRIRALLYR